MMATFRTLVRILTYLNLEITPESYAKIGCIYALIGLRLAVSFF